MFKNISFIHALVFVISLLFFLIDVLLGTMDNILFIGVLSSIYAALIMIPSWAVTVRRLHDVGKSGFFLLIQFIPFIGSLWLFFTLIQKSDGGINLYDEKSDDNEIPPIFK